MTAAAGGHRAIPVDAPPPGAVVLDRSAEQQADLASLTSDAPPDAELRWVYYPWRNTVVAVLGPGAFRRVRQDRNRNKITAAEQGRLAGTTVGVAGLSVGHAIAHTLALEGLCGRLRLADFDAIDLSNLNRIPATVFDLGVNKAVVTARRIAELDPWLPTDVHPEGITDATIDGFLDGLDVLVEEADSIDIKVRLREGARARGIPVVMVTSDRGLLDVERFDLEPDRPLFHGLVGDLDSAALASLSTRDKVPYVMRILGAAELSPRIAASMVEVGTTLSTWPQLGGDVVLGAAQVAAVVRRLGLGHDLPSGRVRLDLEETLDALVAEPATVPGTSEAEESAGPDDILEAIRRAPSGGNVQPWRVERDEDEVRLFLDEARTTTMDVDFRGSHVALGAALFNARVAAARARRLGEFAILPDDARPDLVATLRLGRGTDERLADLDVLSRGTNRAFGVAQPVDPALKGALAAAAAAEGGRLHLVEPGEAMTRAGAAMARADRIRYLTDRLHREMFEELIWPGGDTSTGIDVATLGLDEGDLAKLTIARRPEVMALLAEWGAGSALADDTRDRVASSSALAVVTVPGTTKRHFVYGGMAVEAVWVAAERSGLAVHPVSPVFLYAVEQDDLRTLSEPFEDALAELRQEFRTAVGVADDEAVALVLRLSHGGATPVRSRRRPVGGVPRHA
ncbi:Rv1355c family protein [Actinomycetospora corticicola]|uniref:Molybdopterin/thiamine biosynthesis adenylyltransferase n=1 Tax=Actinomycetospora corticicola TaxID=663602 RepID=A0A7Y9DRK9_9PSEU|nr:Rv1355c family protein [Actinomycetospora corticicola]NYD34228.1 molybdopterin/thiamine biosynthesis adenylyltransferase [Actinomycetospora corticicola]